MTVAKPTMAAALAVLRAADTPTPADMNILASMGRDQVEKLSATDRHRRRDLLAADQSIVTLTMISEMLGHRNRDTVAGFRTNYLKTGQTGFNALPAPIDVSALLAQAGIDPAVSGSRVRRPGDSSPGRGDSPRFYAGVIRRWAQQTERMDADFFPQHRPSGRPRSLHTEPRRLVTVN